MFVFQFSCLHAPLAGYGYWLDRHDAPQTYLHGSNHGQNVCGCSDNSSCIFTPVENAPKCNCDIFPKLQKWLEHLEYQLYPKRMPDFEIILFRYTDYGVITNHSALPIQGFVYGYLPEGGSVKAKVRFGPLQCRGTKSFGDSGASCASLK